MVGNRAVFFSLVLVCAGTFVAACVDDVITPPMDASMDSPAMDAAMDTTVTDTGVDTGLVDSGVPDTPPACGQLGQNCCMMNPACVMGAGCCGGKCVDLQKDDKNCGMCGHDCQGAGCMNGKCSPTLLGATNAKDPCALAVDNSYAYFTVINSNNGSLFRCDVASGCPDGGPEAVLKNLAFAGDVAQTSTNVFVSDGNSSLVHIVNKQNQNDNTVSLTNPYGIDVDQASHAFYIENGTPKQSLQDFTSQVVLLGPMQGPLDIATTGNGYVFWNVFGSQPYIRGAQTGTTNTQTNIVTLQAMTEPGNVAANGAAMVFSWRFQNSLTSEIDVCPYDLSCNNAPKKLAAGQYLNSAGRWGNLILDGADVYWTAHDNMGHGVVMRCQTNGCNMTPTVVAEVAIGQSPAPAGVAVDSTYVYFLMGDNTGTKLYRAKKN